MNHGQCVHCGNDVYESDERVSLSWGVSHFECHEDYHNKADLEMKALAEEDKARYRKDCKILRRLKRTLKAKIWQGIDWTIADHRYQDLQIVGVDKVCGEKRAGHDWFGQSTAMRYIYDDTSTDYWGDSYGGQIWLPIGKGRYLQMHIWG
ncbi:hypothetical protein [Vibrio parahaemolyticus]|uniref:hypothetical protein n=1 Tax=Vibrio parahaemolyticus TaxID=670 RepID=UPI00064990A9|nr:hypothetical protein [Vibrio parahaemolyticus]EII3125378.1 hypothetical protein [Vibrio parahaemolyticus]